MKSNVSVPLSYLMRVNKLKRADEVALFIEEVLRYDFDWRNISEAHRNELRYLLETIALEN